MTEDSQERNIAAVLAGDIDSFSGLADKYYAALVAIGYSVLGDHGLAEDAAQESLAKALVKLKSLRNRKRFAPWLAAICRNIAKDMARDRSRRVGAVDLLSAVASENNEGYTDIVNRAMGCLSSADRELIVLRYYDDLSYEQIVSVTGMSKGAVNGRLTRAKIKLGKYLKRNGFQGDKL